MIFLFVVYFVFIMMLVITFLLSQKSYKKPVIKYIPTLVLFILAFISSAMFVLNNGMGELMISVSLGVAAIVNGLLLLVLKVVRVIVAKGK
ncbi:sugar ABC transporter ATPase [Bacillus thuringiensis]|uniref:sugar ABC transporter ATPase n=1 Tax=Bacillus thuringiensis TaxID=1428 RepID=UPI000BFE060F|nr:sugar ABC transporter ATPase [Bacillus thuringiensis]PGM56464.1 sugar ABC transporter ATPase [Bacillus thuringiensis]PGV72326.1 sugar ABC transporter ATPase [Bacillus thuringiensis]